MLRLLKSLGKSKRQLLKLKPKRRLRKLPKRKLKKKESRQRPKLLLIKPRLQKMPRKEPDSWKLLELRKRLQSRLPLLPLLLLREQREMKNKHCWRLDSKKRESKERDFRRSKRQRKRRKDLLLKKSQGKLRKRKQRQESWPSPNKKLLLLKLIDLLLKKQLLML
jgi:hypothetical protein